MERGGVSAGDFATEVLAGLVLVGLAATRLHNFLLFHSLAEIFSIVVACGTFMVVWNARRYVVNNYVMFIGIALLFVALVDTLHMLAYKGMGVFQTPGSNLTVQLWMVARLLQGVSFLLAPIFIRRRLRAVPVLVFYVLATFLLLASVFYWDLFPVCYTEGAGLTAFKKASEYAVCAVLIGSMFLLLKNRRSFDRHVVSVLVLSLGFTIASELAFTLYVDVDSPVSMLGHLLKIVAFYLIYKAVIEASLVRPHRTLYRELKESEEALRASELRFRRMVDESPDGVVVVSQGGIVRYMNPASQALLGAKADAMIGKPFQHSIKPGKTTLLSIAPVETGTVTLRARMVGTQWVGEPAYLLTLHDISDQHPVDTEPQARLP